MASHQIHKLPIQAVDSEPACFDPTDRAGPAAENTQSGDQSKRDDQDQQGHVFRAPGGQYQNRHNAGGGLQCSFYHAITGTQATHQHQGSQVHRPGQDHGIFQIDRKKMDTTVRCHGFDQHEGNRSDGQPQAGQRAPFPRGRPEGARQKHHHDRRGHGGPDILRVPEDDLPFHHDRAKSAPVSNASAPTSGPRAPGARPGPPFSRAARYPATRPKLELTRPEIDMMASDHRRRDQAAQTRGNHGRHHHGITRRWDLPNPDR